VSRAASRRIREIIERACRVFFWLFPNLRGVAVACFEFFLCVRKFRRATKDGVDSGDRLHSFLDSSRELQGVTVESVIHDENFHGVLGVASICAEHGIPNRHEDTIE
jgi:hypothetical protein